MKRILGILALCLGLCLAAGPAQAAGAAPVALVMKSLSNPFFLKMREGAEAYARDAGITLEVFGLDRETDVDQQLAIMDSLVRRGFGAIVLAPADSRRLVPACKAAQAKGVHVINIDNPLHGPTLAEEGIAVPFVGADNEQGAFKVGAEVVRGLGGKGRVLVIEGLRGAENAEGRLKGFLKALAAAPGITLLESVSANWHTEEAFVKTMELLGRHPDASAILCANDSMALGALQALDTMGKAGKVLVAGYDNLDAVRPEIAAGRIHATLEQHPALMGRYGVQLAVRALGGQPLPKTVETPLDLVTRECFGKLVGFSISDMSSPFFQQLAKGAKATAETFGITLQVVDARADDAAQLADVQKLLSQGVKVLLVNPENSQSIVPALELAASRQIPVITVDRSAAGGKVRSHVASDNRAGGLMAGDFLAGLLGGRGRVLELEGTPGTSAAQDRGAGFQQAMKKYPGMEVARREAAFFDRAKARAAVQRLLASGTAFDAVFAHNDEMLLGAMEALNASAAAAKPLLVGFDAIPEARRLLAQGRIQATVAQQPELMGRQAMLQAVAVLRNQPVRPNVAVDLELLAGK